MEVVDEKGRLFGVVNVVDLLVAVTVVATLAAGTAFVLLDDPTPPRDRYATVVLEEGPTGVTPELDGDDASLNGLDVTVTDVYRAPTGAGSATTIVRVRASVSPANADASTDRRLVTDDGTYTVGQEVDLSSDGVGHVGYVRSLDGNGTALPVENVTATVVTRLPTPIAERVERGDIHRLDGERVARVTNVERERTTDDRTRLTATVELRVLEMEGRHLYGDRILRPGSNLTFATDAYEFTVTVTEVA
jgi:hypothetical protein